MAEIYYFLASEQYQPEELVEIAVVAEQVGFDGVMISEHFHPWVDDVGASGFGFSTLGAIASRTQRIKLMTGVTTPLYRYHPGIVAQAAATIDRLSDGRFELGVGTGENINEGPLGFAFPKYTERAARMREALEVMRRLLEGEKVDYSGEYYKLQSARLYSPPVNKVGLWMAAAGPKSSEIAGELADGVITSVKDVAETMEQVVQPAKLVNKETQVMASRWCVLAENNDEAWRALGAMRGLRVVGRMDVIDSAVLREKADGIPREEILSKYSVVNEVDQLLEIYKPLISSLGANKIALQVASSDWRTTLEKLGKEVLGELRKM